MTTQPTQTAHDSVHFDSAINTEPTAAGDAALLAADLAKAQAESAELKDRLLRMAAETENLRRRLERERDDAVKFASAKFAKDILSVADNLGRALQNAPKPAEGDAAKTDPLNNLLVGIEATERELLSVFERFGIQRIDPQGQRFDPNLHQAMFEVENPNLPAGTVFQVIAAGYVQHGRLLRAAMVGVTKGGPQPDSTTAGSVDTKA
ncbi:nucleotide exchange factor GrpE [Ferrovibrio sp.]|uniref:nucleotide exchange factor GrpE n=1 Tax=Ferrovibrio sp. TaxID=1917215 RepID=UPI003D1079F7